MKNIEIFKKPVKARRLMSDGREEKVSLIAEYDDRDGKVFTCKSKAIGDGAVHSSHIKVPLFSLKGG